MARTKGRIEYTELESQDIVRTLTNMFMNDPGIVSLIKANNKAGKDARYIESVEMAEYIKKNLVEKIQDIFRDCVDVKIEPSQAVTKNECIISRKNVIKAVLEI